MLKNILLVSAAILLGFTPLPGPMHADARSPQEAAPAPAPAVTNPAKSNSASLGRAKKLYVEDCLMCHGANGNGKTDLATEMQLTLSDWTDPKALSGRPDGELFKIIRGGKDKMPPEVEGRAKDSDVWDLILYIRGMSKGQPAAEPKPAN
jgi:cytochrome c